MDLDDICVGDKLSETLRRELDQTIALLLLLGPGWDKVADKHGNMRLGHTYDYHRQEIAYALQNAIPVVPVLHSGASLPNKENLPSELSAVTDLSAFAVRTESFDQDYSVLKSGLEQRLDTAHRIECETIADNYKLLGFSVLQNDDDGYHGFTVERNVPGAGLTRYRVVSVSTLSMDASASVVKEAISSYGKEVSSHRFTALIVIVETDTQKQKLSKLCGDDILRIAKRSDLKRSLFEMHEGAMSCIQRYESTEIFKEYIPLDLQYEDGAEVASSDLFDLVARGDESKFFVILGDFGAGKTTLMQRLQYNVAKNYIAQQSPKKPLYAPLRRLADLKILKPL